MGSKAPVADFQSDPRATVFPFLGGLFFVKQLHGAHFSIARDLRAAVGYLLRTTYHMSYARGSHLGIPSLPAVSRRIRWKLTGFELGPHFPLLNKFRKKCF